MRASFPPGYRFKRSPPASLLLGAFRRRDMAAMAALIAAGADLNQRYSAGQLTLLYIAAVEGGEEMVKFLCSYKGKIDLNLPDCDGITPLYIAVQNNREGVVEILCAQDDIDTNAKDKHGNSALWKAVWDQKYAIVEILLRNQTTNLNILNKEGETPLKIAFFNQDKKMVDLFCQIRDRIDVQKIFLYLNRFLSVSLIRKDLSWFKFLYVIYLESRQENISVLNEIGVFYLLLIILTNNPVALEFMEECTHKFINGKTYLSRIINMLNEEGEAPLFFAAKHGQAQFFSLLLKNGADLRLEDKEGFAPLYIAARNGHANMVKLFIQAYEQQFSSTDAEVFSAAMRIAQVMKHDHIVSLFLDSHTSWTFARQIVVDIFARLPPFMSASPPIESAAVPLPISSSVMASAELISPSPKERLVPTRRIEVIESPAARASSAIVSVLDFEVSLQFNWKKCTIIIPKQRREGAGEGNFVLAHPFEKEGHLLGYFAISPKVSAGLELTDLRTMLNATCARREFGQGGFKWTDEVEKFKLVTGRWPQSSMGPKMKYRKTKIRILSEQISFNELTPLPLFKGLSFFWFCGIAEKID